MFNARLIVFSVILVAMAVASKIYFGDSNNWSGLSPVIAIALFSGMIMRRKNFSFLLPLMALLVSDAVIELLYRQGLFAYQGFYSGQWKNYLFLLLPTLIGWMLRGKNYGSLLAGAIAGPTVFFLVSNFSVWLGAHVLYSRDFSGLMSCYAAGLPFYKNALLGTLVFLPAIVVLYNFMTRQKTQLTLA